MNPVGNSFCEGFLRLRRGFGSQKGWWVVRDRFVNGFCVYATVLVHRRGGGLSEIVL